MAGNGPDGAGKKGHFVRRHPLALLALLAAARGGPVTRDKLAAWLWPEADGARARHCLSNALHRIRRDLDPGVIVAAGDDVRLDPGAVTCDVTEFEAAIEAGDRERAVALYRGPFLDGFHLPNADEFESWTSAERDRLARAYEEALESLAEASADRNDWLEAVHWWERRARHDPSSSRAALGLMTALVASGDRAQALHRGEAHAAVLEAELGVGPDPAVRAFMDQIKGVLPPLHPAFHPRAFRESGAAAPRVAVLPFENLCGEEDAYLVDGLVNDLLASLSREQGIAVLSRTTSLKYGNGARSVGEIERETGARYVVEGAVQRLIDRMRITVQLIDAHEDQHLWAERYERPVGKAYEIQAEIADAVARELGARLRRRVSRSRPRVPRDGEAYRLYQEARFHGSRRRREDVERAMAAYEEAIDRDPDLAEAQAGLVDVLFTARWMGFDDGRLLERAEAACSRALAADPDLPEGQAASALVCWWRGDLEGASRGIARALELDPSLVTAHHRYAILLACRGDLEASLREILTALALDPLSPVLRYNVGVKYMLARDYDGAVRRFRDAIDVEPTWADAHSAIALARGLQGRFEEALEVARRAANLAPESGDIRLERAWVLGAAGREAEARRELAQGIELGGNPVEAGIGHLPLGNVTGAMEWIARGDWRIFDRVRRWDPRLDPVRTDPRFLELLG